MRMPFTQKPLRRNQLARKRPWLLLWLLPYLFLGIFSGAHNHDIADCDGHATSVAATQLQPQVDSPEKGSLHFDCLACHWASEASALCSAPLRLTPAADSTQFIPASVFHLTPRTLATGSIRGPPVV